MTEFSSEYELIEFFDVLPTRSEGCGFDFQFKDCNYQYSVVIEKHFGFVGVSVKRCIDGNIVLSLQYTNCIKAAVIELHDGE